jgi:multisubunit Na+/H+ antiporter MnhB subunit
MTVVAWGGLSWTVLALPPQPVDLEERVAQHLGHSGVTNPVTAVLINFRGYDTLLEVAVLVLAVFAVWSLPESRIVSTPREERVAEPVLLALVRSLTPLMVVIGGYLLWAGAHAPGGAFQGGAIWAAALVLLLLSGFHFFARFPRRLLRLTLVIGLVVFLVVSVGVMTTGGRLLEYPQEYAKDLILLIETSVTVSIACILTSLFVGRLENQSAPEVSTRIHENAR